MPPESAMSRYHAIATRYDSGFTTDYTCDSCRDRVKSSTLPAGWIEDGDSHRCSEGCGTGASAPTFQGMGVAEGAELVMANLSRDDIEYAADTARGEYRGFAALHDRMDANMILPFADEGDSIWTDDGGISEEYASFANAVSDEVTRRILSA